MFHGSWVNWVKMWLSFVQLSSGEMGSREGRKEKLVSAARLMWSGKEGGDRIYLLHYIKLGLNSLLPILLSNRFSSVLSNKCSVWQIARAKTGMWEESPKFCFNLNFLEVLQIENSESGREITIFGLQFHYLGWQGSQY